MWPAARGPWVVQDSSTKHASWYGQLGKLPNGLVQKKIIRFLCSSVSHAYNPFFQDKRSTRLRLIVCISFLQANTNSRRTCHPYKGGCLLLSVIVPPCRLLHVFLSVKLLIELREAGGGVQSNQEGMLRRGPSKHSDQCSAWSVWSVYQMQSCYATQPTGLCLCSVVMVLLVILRWPCTDPVWCLCSTIKDNFKGYQLGLCFPFKNKGLDCIVLNGNALPTHSALDCHSLSPPPALLPLLSMNPSPLT